MVLTALPGLSGHVSAILDVPPPTRSGWRYADAIDAIEIPNASVGDFIIDGPNITSGGKAIIDTDFYPGDITLNGGPFAKKLIISGGFHYNYLKLYRNTIAGSEGSPVIITNYNGQVRWGGRADSANSEHTFGIAGPTHFRLTGKYDPILGTGDINYQGHANATSEYEFTSGQYGFWGTMNWVNQEYFIFGIGGSTATGMSNNFEVDFCEFSDGGFGINLKWDYPPISQNVAMTYKWHDNYHHDLGGEGGYFGQNTNNGSHRMVDCEIYNNRMVRVANEALQMGNFAEGCDIHHNIFVQCDMRWKSPFERYQDRGIQLTTRNGRCRFRNNILLGVSDYFLVLANDNGLNAPPDNPVAGQDIEITDNVIFCTRNQGIYIFSVSDGVTGFKINDNWIFYFQNDSVPENRRYSSVYIGATPATFIIASDNTTDPIEVKRNKYQQGLNLLRNNPGNITLDGNEAMPAPALPLFKNSGFPDNFDWLNASQWSAYIGEALSFYGPGTNKGQPNVFNTGDYCWHKSKCYRSKQMNNFAHEPTGQLSDFWWELILWNGGTRPPDDFRLRSEDIFNQLDIGLLDNDAPDTLAIPMDQAIFEFLFQEPEVFDPTEIQIAAIEDGNNNVRLRIDFPANILTTDARIVAIGSSTLAGSGATSPNKLHELLAAWTAANVPQGSFLYMAVPGTYSAYFIPDDQLLSDWNRNVDAALSLQPDILIVSLPSNDPAFVSNEVFLNNLKAIDARAKQQNVYAFFTTTQPRNGYDVAGQQALYDAAQLIKAEFKKRAVDVFTGMANPYTVTQPATMKPVYDSGDTIHPNNAGHAYVRDQIVATMQAYFVNKAYQNYQIERSTSPTSGFALLYDNITDTDVLLPRTDGQLYYYRVRARRANSTYTAYSNTVSLRQAIYAGDVLQRVQFNFTRSENPDVYVGWNNLIPSGNIPNAGETFTGIKDAGGLDTPYGVRIDGDFENTTSGGGRAGVYPLGVIRSNWRVGNGSRARVTITGLDDDYLYDFKFLSSQLTQSAYRYTGFSINGRSAFIAANDPVAGSNDSLTADILSVKPVGGEVTFTVRALPNSVLGYLNALTLEKRLNSNAVPMEQALFDFLLLEPLVIGGSTLTGTVLVNFTGPVDSGRLDWNDINVVSGQVYQDVLLTTDNNNSQITITILNTQENPVDNGSSYTGTLAWPADILRYARYRSGNPPMQIRLGNLNTTRLYDIELMASRMNNDNVVSFTIGAETKQVSVNNNIDTPVVFTDVRPDVNGFINIVESYVSGTNTGYTYLNAMKITIKADDSPVVSDQQIFDILLQEPDVKPPADAPVPMDQGLFDILLQEPTIREIISNDNSEISTNLTYVNAERFMRYKPAGVATALQENPNKKWKAIVFLHGAGRTISNLMGEGIPLMLSQGDNLNCFVYAPAGYSGMDSWNETVSGQMRPKWMYDWLIANDPIDPDCVYFTGLSLGGAGSFIVAQAFPGIPAAIMPVAGSQPMDYPWATIRDIAVWSLHGASDGTQDRTNTIRVGDMNKISPPPKYPAMMSLFWGKGHSGAVWHDEVYRRKSSPLSGTKSKFDYDKWFFKYSKDPVKTGYGHVEYLEANINIVDYLYALRVVNALPASADKTAMQARMAAVKPQIYTKAYVIDIGGTTYTSAAPINNITTVMTNGTAITNLADIDGGTSTKGFSIPAFWANWQPLKEFTDRLKGAYYGLPDTVSRDYGRINANITTGTFRFTGLDNAKLYKVVILHSFEQVDDTAQQSTCQVTIGATTIAQYCQMNTFLFMEFDNITPASGVVNGAVRAPNGRDAGIQAIILIEKN